MFLSNRGSFRPETSGAYTLRRRGRRRPKSGSAIGACAVARLAGSGGPIGDYYGSANKVLHGAALGEDPHAAGNAAGVEDQLDVHVLQNDAAGKTDGPEERGAVALHDGASLGVGGVRVPPGEQGVADQLQHSAQVVVDELPPLRVLDELIGGQRQRGPQCHGRKANDGAFFPAVAAGGQPQKEERAAAGDDGGIRVSHIVKRGGFEHGIGGDEVVLKDEGDVEEVEREAHGGVEEGAPP